VTYYQFTAKRPEKVFGSQTKTCAQKNQRLEQGELFVTFTDGAVVAHNAKVCPFCGAIFTEHYFDSADGTVENAHFLKTDSEN